MDLVDTVLAFLKERRLDAVAETLRVEAKQKKAKGRYGREERLRSILNGALRDEPPLQSLTSEFLLKRIAASKPSRFEQKWVRLSVFKKLVKTGARFFEERVREIEDEGPASFSFPQVEETREDKPAEGEEAPSSILQISNSSFGGVMMEEDAVDEYEDEDDPGFEAYDCSEEDLAATSVQTAEKYGFPARATMRPRRTTESKIFTREEVETSVESKKEFKSSVLPGNIRFPDPVDSYYPKECEDTIYDCFKLKVIYDREKTGFEESKEFQIVINSVIAGRYKVVEYLGSAAFSKAIQCLDLLTNQAVCMKIIENNKDYFDQSIDEIKLLNYINVNGDVDAKNVLRIFDFFYHKEHLFIVTELLRDNLYEFCKYNRENEPEPYFTIGHLQKITYQTLIALEYLHSLKLIHCDLKPENILIKSYSRCEVKVIDLGSSCFIHDHLSSYVQSRSYRAPEVILGCKYDYRVDIWSLGCILAELWTGNVLFQNETVQGLLSRVIGILGGLPDEMYQSGRLVSKFFTKERLLYQEASDQTQQNQHLSEEMQELIKKSRKPKKKLQILVPKRSSLRARLKTDDAMFLDFVRCLLDTDRERRPTASEALKHPWIVECKYTDGLP